MSLFLILNSFSAMFGICVIVSPSSAVLPELANWSAISFPLIPAGLGIQFKFILVPADLRLLIC